MVARLGPRLARLERLRPPPESGCERCRGHRVLGIGEFIEREEEGRTVRRCAICGHSLTGCKVIMVDLREVR